MLKDKVKSGLTILSDMPGWLFWTLLLALTWYCLISKIVSLDLWWHLACGRFYVENGCYPPTGTFTFSPVNPFTSNAKTWLGDIVLYLIHFAGGDLGLQFFRAILTLLPVWVLVQLAGKKYNLWLLFLSVLTISGTLQMQLLRNSMYGLLFLPVIVWLWWHIRQKDHLRTYWLVFLFAPIMGVWSIMHGYALVGTYIVLLIFAGEMLDLFIRNRPRKWAKGIIFTSTVICMCLVVNITLPLNIVGTASSFLTEFRWHEPQKTDTDIIKDKNEKSSPEKPEYQGGNSQKGLIGFLKSKTRFLMKGGDVGFIGEYESPFDYFEVIFVKALFLFECVFGVYLIIALLFIRQVRFSFLLPSLAIAFIGMGYIRTTAFPFLVAAPFMVADCGRIARGRGTVQNGIENRLGLISADYLNLIPLTGILAFFIIAHYYILTDNYGRFSGITAASPGFGRSDRHRTHIPQYALEKYPDVNMYNTYNTGSLLIWEWYGKKKVFIDGRSVTYKLSFYQDFRYTYSVNAIEKMDLRHALFSVIDDYDWFSGYLRQNWDIECFDTGMLILNRRVKEGYDSFYGNIPKFIGNLNDIDQLSADSKMRFGRFLDVTFKYMMIFGRLNDSLTFYSDIQGLLRKLPASVKGFFEDKKRLMDDVEKEFGRQNSAVLVELFKEILLTDEQDRKDASITWKRSDATIYVAFANAHFRMGNQKKGVEFLCAAADEEKGNGSLQLKVADHFYNMRALGPAIKYYERGLSLISGKVLDYNRLGSLYFQKGDKDNARINFEKAVKADPDIVESYINLAAVLLFQGRTEQALEVNAQGLKIDPDNPDLLGMKKDIEAR